MPLIEINLHEVVEKPRLPAGQDFEFAIIAANPGIAKQPNKNTGVKEPYVSCEIHPVDPTWADRKLYHIWSLSSGALASDDPVWSIKKFFAVVGYQLGEAGNFATEDLQTIRFVGQAAYKEGDNRPKLSKVLRRA